MDKELFADLLQSVKDMDKIMRGETVPPHAVRPGRRITDIGRQSARDRA